MPDLHTEILNSAHALIMVLDARGEVAFFNRMCERVSGYTLAELDGTREWEKLLLPEEVESVRSAHERLRQGDPESTHENHWIAKSGERRLIEWTNSALRDDRGRLAYIVGAGIDVTERKRAQRSLLETAQRQRGLLDSLPDAVWLKDAGGVFLEVNRPTEARCGRVRAEMIGRKARDFPPAPLAEQWDRDEQHVLRAKQPFHSETCRTIDGATHWFDTVITPVSDEAGNVIGTAGVSRDVTSKENAEQLIRSMRLREKALLDGIPDIAWLKDGEGRYIAANKAFCEALGVNPAAIAGKRDCDLFPSPGVERLVGEEPPVVSAGEPRRFERLLTHSDRGKWFETITVPIAGEGGRIVGMVGVSRDITERKFAEAQRMIRDSALRASLLKEIHHRIKNNLQGVITLIQQLASKHPEGAAVLEALVARLNAIALVYGLQAATGERDLPLEQILMGFVSSFKALHDDPPVRVSLGGSAAATRVTESEIVPLALIVGELVTNAIKHSRPGDGTPVEIALQSAADRANIVICNRTGRLGRHVDFDADVGLGVGLSLVKSMMPPDGVRLKLENMEGDGVRAEISLYPPAIATSDRID